MRQNVSLWLCLVSALAGAVPAQDRREPSGTYFTTAVTPRDNPKLHSADYALWIPEGGGALRGILMRQHGCGTQTWKIGLNHVHDAQWQALARRHSLALMSSRYVAPDECDAWTDLSRGSDLLFLEAVDRFARQTGHAELATVPWVLWGHSGGARWSGQMLLKYPRRVAAAVLARCGETATENPEAAQVPVLWVPAARDHLAHCVATPLRSCREYRQQGAFWTMAVDPVAGHELAEQRTLAIPYLDAVLTQRLPKGRGALRPMDPSRVWLGNPENFEIAPAASYRGDPRQAVWLPGEATARCWKEFVTTGRVTPRRSLPAVEHLRVTAVSATEVELTWRIGVEPETGMPSFAILRDGHVIGGVPGQSHGYHDDPSPVEIKLAYRDSNLTADREYSYRVVPLASHAASARMPVIPSAAAAAGRSADLVITRLSWSPALTAVVENRGTQATPVGIPIEVVFRINNLDAGWAEHPGALPAGASATLTLTRAAGKTPAAALLRQLGSGSHRLEAVVDYRNRIMETSEENNLLAILVGTPAP